MSIFWTAVIIVAVVVLAGLSLSKPKRRRTRPAQPGGSTTRFTPVPLPKSFPVSTKASLLTRTEAVAFDVVRRYLAQSGMTVHACVRLADVFDVQGDTLPTIGRIRDKHVDLLILDAAHRPRCGIEIDGRSHDTAEQQHRDRVKDLLFKSAGLPLIRLDARGKIDAARLTEQLQRALAQLPTQAAS